MRGRSTITIPPGGTWICTQACMVLHQGYLADWVAYISGDTLINPHPDFPVTFDVDYGE